MLIYIFTSERGKPVYNSKNGMAGPKVSIIKRFHCTSRATCQDYTRNNLTFPWGLSPDPPSWHFTCVYYVFQQCQALAAGQTENCFLWAFNRAVAITSWKHVTKHFRVAKKYCAQWQLKGSRCLTHDLCAIFIGFTQRDNCAIAIVNIIKA